MGRRGPPPTDAKILRLRGTYRSDRHAQVRPPIRVPGKASEMQPPGWFNEELHAIWHRLLSAVPNELLGPIDADLLAVLCEAIHRHGQAVVALREVENAPTTTATAEVIANLTKRVRHAATDVRASAASLAITPAARARLSLPQSPEEERYLGRFVRIG